MATPADRRDRREIERDRIRASPEYLYRAIRRRMRQMSIPPSGTVSSPSNRTPPDALVDLISLMNARLDLVSRAGFRPREYPRIDRQAAESDDDGWIAWFILTELRVVVAFAERQKDARADKARLVLRSATSQAKAFVGRQLARAKGLSFDDRARCEAMIPRILRGVGPGGGGDDPDYDPAGHERERVNELLEIASPWETPPRPASLASQIVGLMRKNGFAPDAILQELERKHVGHSAEAAELRESIAGKTKNAIETPEAAAAKSRLKDPNHVDLRDRHRVVLEAMLELGATSEDLRKSASEIASCAVGRRDASTTKTTLVELRRWALVSALDGRSGGYWLTRKGKAAAAKPV